MTPVEERQASGGPEEELSQLPVLRPLVGPLSETAVPVGPQGMSEPELWPALRWRAWGLGSTCAWIVLAAGSGTLPTLVGITPALTLSPIHTQTYRELPLGTCHPQLMQLWFPEKVRLLWISPHSSSYSSCPHEGRPPPAPPTSPPGPVPQPTL